MGGPGCGRTGADDDRANVARVYDYFLGGAHNFAVDRELGDRIERSMPSIRRWAAGNRRFLGRLVRFCAEQGVRQFLDLGSGIPTTGHVHEIARSIVPDARVVYVDVEPVAVAHSRQVLADVAGVGVTHADIRLPATVLGAPTTTDVLDFREPVAVLAVAVLHFVLDDDQLRAVLGAYREALAPGSVLGLTHSSSDYDDPGLVSGIRAAAADYDDSATPLVLRDRRAIRDLLGPLRLVDPGVVDLNRWRSDDDGPDLGGYAAVGLVT